MIDSARQQPLDIGGLPRFGANIVALAAQQRENLDDTRGRIEANGIAGTAATGGIVGQHQRQPTVTARRGAELGPSRREARNIVDTISMGLVVHAGEFEARIDSRFGLEGDGARQQATVEFGQHDVHRQIRWRQAARRALPGFARTARQYNLQDRRVGNVEHRCLVFTQGRESRRVQDHPRLAFSDEPREIALDCRVLKAADSNAKSRKTLPVERL